MAHAVATQLRVRARAVDDDERWGLEHAITQRAVKHFDDLEPAVASWLVRIEAKLDCLLAAMGMPQDDTPLTGEPQDVQLSEKGVALRLDLEVAIGDLLLVELELPGPPLHTLMVLARATDASAAGLAHLGFETLHEADRKAIVAHSLDVQRRALRLRSGIDGEPT